MKPSLLRLAAAAVLLAPLALLAQSPTAVRITTPKPVTSAQSYSVPGRTEPLEAATLFSRATGIVRERKADIGDVVKAGQVLAIIDTPEIDRAIEAARAAVDQAVARADNARVLAERATSLLASNVNSREETDQRVASANELAAAVRVARAELARLEEQQKFSTVRAPFDAIVVARNFDRGDRVRGDSATAEGWLYRLVRTDTLRFAIAATPDLALRLKADQSATIRFNEFPGKTFAATVARTSRTFDTTTGTMRVELALENKDLALPSGLTGTAVFALPPASDVVVVPTNTLLTREGQSFVATVDSGKVAFIAVTPRRNFGAEVEVVSEHLARDAAVIINPNSLLRAGDPVEIKAAPRPDQRSAKS